LDGRFWPNCEVLGASEFVCLSGWTGSDWPIFKTALLTLTGRFPARMEDRIPTVAWAAIPMQTQLYFKIGSDRFCPTTERAVIGRIFQLGGVLPVSGVSGVIMP
jgi:hypothetical protein